MEQRDSQRGGVWQLITAALAALNSLLIALAHHWKTIARA
jgi:hypothetical protein